MGSHKPRSKVDRLPVDYGDAPRRRRAQVEQGGDWGAMLSLTPLTEEEREARAARALAVLRAFGAEDLAEALGLTGTVERPPVGRERVRIIDLPCTKCDAKPGQYCVSLRTGVDVSYHEDRRRRAAEMQQEAA